METKANYVLIGAFTLVVAAFLLLFGLWAAKFSSERDWREYRVVFTEPVTGLTEGSSVQYNGIAIGTVETLDLDPKDPRRVIAKLKVKAGTPVKVDTRAKLSITGLTGVPFNDAYDQYLSYHEGWTGYRRGTYKSKPWLMRVARIVQARASRFAAQYRYCP